MIALAACGTGRTAERARPIGEDPLALLPSGTDALVDIDVAQLRDWAPARRLLDLLPPAARADLAALGFDPLDDVDTLYIALDRLGTPEQTSTLLLETQLPVDKLRRALGPSPTVTDWRGVAIHETAPGGPDGDRALARITPKYVCMGSRANVRRVLDLARGEGTSLREDKRLMHAYGRAPTAKTGRAAIIAGVAFDDPLRERLRKEDLPLAEAEELSLAFAVGDGFDLGAIAFFRGPAEAGDALKEGKRRLDAAMRSTAVRLLQLRQLLEPIILVQREYKVHLAYRLAGKPLDRMLARLESLHPAPSPEQQTTTTATTKATAP
jgi:hypothetical protein